MALNINGTTGISGVDGSASAPALTGTDSNTGINFASDTVKINTGGVTRATVDSTGRLLVGTTTGDPYGNRQLTVASSGTTTALELRSPTNGTGRIYFTDSTASGTGAYMASVQYDHTNNFMKFETNGGNERMRIDSSGVVFVGTTSSSPHTDGSGININPTAGLLVGISNTHAGIFARHSSDGECLRFQRDNTDVGSIDVSSSSTSYNTSSDYRLKENVVSISDGITRLKTLKPSRFNFKVDTDTTVDGFLAHEVTAVPEATTGTKDEVDSDNNPVYQGIDQSKLVPLLTAALQEAIAKIEVLETKVAALEAG